MTTDPLDAWNRAIAVLLAIAEDEANDAQTRAEAAAAIVRAHLRVDGS